MARQINDFLPYRTKIQSKMKPLLLLLMCLCSQLLLAQSSSYEITLDQLNSTIEEGQQTVKLRNGNILLVGQVDNTIGNNSAKDALVICLNPTTQAVLWSRAYGWKYDDHLNAGGKLLSDGTVVLGGQSSTSQAGMDNMWMIRLDASSGAVLSSARFQASSGSSIQSITESRVADHLGNNTSILVAGAKSGYQKAYIARFNMDGTIIWEKDFQPANGTGQINALIEDVQQNIYMAGNANTATANQAWLVRANSGGMPVGNWLYDFGTNSRFEALRYHNLSNSLLLAGQTNSKAFYTQINPLTLPRNAQDPRQAPLSLVTYNTSFDSYIAEFIISDDGDVLAGLSERAVVGARARVLHLNVNGTINQAYAFDHNTVIGGLTELDSGGVAVLGSTTNGGSSLYFSITNNDLTTDCNENINISATLVTNPAECSWTTANASFQNPQATSTVAPQATALNLQTGNSCSAIVGNFNTNTEEFVALFPNPTKAKVMLQLSNHQEWVQGALFNAQGRKIKTLMINSNLLELDLTDFPKGLYIIRLENNQAEQISRKIIKQ